MTEITHSSLNPPADLAEVPRLAQRAATDRQAFARLYQLFVARVFRYLYSRTNNAQIAEDLTSQTFITAFQSIHTLRQPERFTSWLFTIARNKTMDHYRRHDLEKASPLELLQVDPAYQLKFAIPPMSDEDLYLRDLTARLSEPDQELLRLKLLGGMTFKQIAHLLGKNESAVKKTYYRLLTRLQSQLEQDHEN